VFYLAKEGWWNGVNVLVKDNNNELSPMYPPTEPSRKLYDNDHMIHSARFAEFAPYFLNFFQSIFRFNLYRVVKLLAKFIFDYVHSKNDFSGRFEYANTYSDDLPRSQYARFREVNG